MLSFDPPKRAIIILLDSNGFPSENTEKDSMVYVHGIDNDNVIIERQYGQVEVLPRVRYSIKFDPNTASKAEAKLRVQGTDLARITDEPRRVVEQRKKHHADESV